MRSSLLLLAALSLAAVVSTGHAAAPKLASIPLKDLDGKPTTLGAYSGKVLLVVNVASQCGYTPQYKGLEALYQSYKAKGLVVLGFPCNDFGSQEPGTNEEIRQFCTSKYSVTFPMFDKLHVKGPEQHELYKALTGPESSQPGPVKWNFGKFLIGRDGALLSRYDSSVKPESDELKQAIEKALAAK